MYGSASEVIEEQMQQGESVLSRDGDSGNGTSEAPSSWMNLNTPVLTQSLASNDVLARTEAVPSRIFTSTPSILSPQLPTRSVPLTSFPSPLAHSISSTSKPTEHELMYSRRNPNSSPRTPYNDILKNIHLKLPKRLANESTFIQSHRLSYYSGSTYLGDFVPQPSY